MAVMVRAVGIPARVALGYTPGQVQRDGSRLITSDDAHAWVEVYFQSLGWVPFDPTPIAIDRAVDLPWAPRADSVAGVDTDVPAPVPSAPTAAPPTPRRDRATEGLPSPGTSQGRNGTPWPLLVGTGVALLAAAAIGTPAGIRARQRRRRLVLGDAGALWDELAATALDVGVRLHPAWTPRRTARELAGVVARPGTTSTPGAADAVVRLALAEEAACYGPAGRTSASPDPATLQRALRTARRGLLRSASRSVRLRSLLWPASLMAGAGARLTGSLRRRLVALGGRVRRPRAV
jgi:hypothetical protein